MSGTIDEIILGPGDGAAPGAISLLDRDAHYLLHSTLSGLEIGPIDRDGHSRDIRARLRVLGADTREFYANWQAILDQLASARLAWPARLSGRPGIVLSLRLRTDEWTYYDVIDGVLAEAGPLLRQADGTTWRFASLTLTTLPYGRGDRYMLNLTPDAPARNLSGSVFDLAAPPGDAPALARVTVTDRSASGVINRLRIATESRASLTPGSYLPIIPFTAEGFGNVDADDDAVTGEVATATTSAAWQSVGIARKPDGCVTVGHMDLWVRVRDGAVALAPPVGVSVEQAPGIALVQTATSGSLASTSESRVSWPAATTAGNALFLVVATNLSGTPTVPAGWTLADSSTGTAQYPRTWLYYQLDAASQSGQVTVTLPANADMILMLLEYSGVAASNALDKTASSESYNPSAPSGTTATTTQAYELAVAAWGALQPKAEGGPSNGYGLQASATATRVSHAIFWGYTATRLLTSTGTTGSALPLRNDSTPYSAGVVATFKAAVASAPSLSTGTYQYRVVAVGPNGELSAASDMAQAVLSGDLGTTALRISWQPMPNAASYRVYWRKGGSWSYATVSGTAWVQTSTSAGTVADPPVLPSAVPCDWRLAIGTASGQVVRSGQPFTARAGAGKWELLHAGDAHLPPLPVEVGDETGWQVVIQCRHPKGLDTQVAADVLVLMPHPTPARSRPQAHMQWQATDGTTGQLAVPRAWTLATGRAGALSARLRDPDTGEDAGMLLQAYGGVEIGPGDSVLLIAADVADGVSQVEDCAYDVSIEITPRTSYLFGGL